ncbi:terpene synthase family protein [Streptomyces noursei]|uniref:terpene synthase family protein n=1 Tax=Streptomyces noursei TaxID=1971 RepID=UPI0037FAC25F
MVKPSLYCPFPLEIHPQLERIRARTNEWLTRWGICVDDAHLQRLLRLDTGFLAGAGMPRGDEGRVQIVSDLMLWETAIDDLFDETALGKDPSECAVVAAKVQRAVEAPKPHVYEEEPLAAALRDIRTRLEAAGATAVQIARWLQAMRTYLFGSVTGVFYRARMQTCDPSTYMTHRLDSIGTLPITSLMDFAEGFHLSAAEWGEPAVRALTELTILLTGIQDDIIDASGNRLRDTDEVVSGFGDLNIVDLIARERDLSHERGLAQAIALHDALISRMAALGDAVARQGSPELIAYVRTQRSYVRSCFEWYHRIDRYGVRADSAPVAPTPSHGFDPLSIPSIACLWDLYECESNDATTAGATDAC